jgi:hypothetical protein
MGNNRSQKTDRAQEPVKVSAPDRTWKALQAGPHGSVKQSDGSTQASPNPHRRTHGGLK